MMTLQRSFPFDFFRNYQIEFYSLYMVCLLKEESYNEAKYLWKRTPSLFRGENNQHNSHNSHNSNSSSFFALPLLWNLGKLLFQNEISKGLHYIQQLISSNSPLVSDPDSSLVVTVLQDIYELNIQKLLSSLSVAYRPFLVNTVKKYLEINDDNAISQSIPFVFLFACLSYVSFVLTLCFCLSPLSFTVLHKYGYQVNDQHEVSALRRDDSLSESRMMKEFLDSKKIISLMFFLSNFFL
jgi:hypothetical protein